MGNANNMKLRNQRSIINFLRQQPMSRADLSRRTGLTRAAISVLIDTLLGEGIVIEDQLVTGKVGRTSVTIKLNPKNTGSYPLILPGISAASDFAIFLETY